MADRRSSRLARTKTVIKARPGVIKQLPNRTHNAATLLPSSSLPQRQLSPHAHDLE